MHYRGRSEEQIAAMLAAIDRLTSEDVSTLLDRVTSQQQLVGRSAWEETQGRIEAASEPTDQIRFREAIQAAVDAKMACLEAGISGDAAKAIDRATRALALWRYLPTEQWVWLYQPFFEMWRDRYPETPHPFAR